MCVFLFATERKRGNNPSKFGANGLGAGQEVVDLVYGEQKRFPTENNREQSFDISSLWWSASNDIMLAQPSMCHLTPQLRVFAQRMKSLCQLATRKLFCASPDAVAPQPPAAAALMKKRRGRAGWTRTNGRRRHRAAQHKRGKN